jgi:hypothetical protein
MHPGTFLAMGGKPRGQDNAVGHVRGVGQVSQMFQIPHQVARLFPKAVGDQ